MFKLLIEPLILPELITYLNRVSPREINNQNEVFKETVINTVIRLFNPNSSNQGDDLVDPDVEIFVTNKENEVWAESFCKDVVNIQILNREESSD